MVYSPVFRLLFGFDRVVNGLPILSKRELYSWATLHCGVHNQIFQVLYVTVPSWSPQGQPTAMCVES